ncbi:ABC transporter permease subunit [Mesoplasma seiffertii]|uniref:ABC transporter permease subunit n=1 Tax=Mesoplasma seiffertii TaxID=28224 RepID=UPI00047B38CE|nr:ABC transporter permease subunit [Mesoplasma seiffertii]
MLNKYIIKNTFKGTWLMWAVLTLTSTALMTIFFFLVEDDQVKVVLGKMYFGSIGIEIPIIFTAIVGNKIVAREIEKGYMAYYLSTPLSRTKILVSKAFVFLMLIIMSGVVYLCVGYGLIAMTGANLSYGDWTLWMINLTLLSTVFAGIAWIFSCLFNKTGWSIVCGAGIPAVFFILTTLSMIETLNVEFLKYFSVITLFDPISIVGTKVTTWLFQDLGLLMITVGLFAGGIYIFKNKDLPL